MTGDQADELLRKNDWSKWSDARELLMEAAHIGAMDERKNLDAKLRRLAAVEAQRDELLEALKELTGHANERFSGGVWGRARAAIKAVEEGK